MEVIVERLNELRVSRGNPTYEWIAEASGVPKGTVINIFRGKTHFPNCDTMYKIVVKALKGSLDKLLADSNVSLGDVQPLKEEAESLLQENQNLKNQTTTLIARNAILRMQIRHKDEIIRLLTPKI